MKLTYDPEVDAAYLSLTDHIKNGEVATTKCFPLGSLESDTAINADFSLEGVLLGFEILGASNCLAAEILDRAEQLC